MTTDPTAALRTVRAHVEQAYEWHRSGTKPTGQSAELGAALWGIDNLLASQADDPSLDEKGVRYGYQRGHADAQYQRGYREDLAATNWRAEWDEKAVLARQADDPSDQRGYDPEHPDGAYCANTTGLPMCYHDPHRGQADDPSGPDVKRLRQAFTDVSAGYMMAPDYFTDTYWRKVVQRYRYLALRESPDGDER